MPAWVKVCENVFGAEATPESQVSGACVRVVVWGGPLSQCHSTVSPTLTVTVPGEHVREPPGPTSTVFVAAAATPATSRSAAPDTMNEQRNGRFHTDMQHLRASGARCHDTFTRIEASPAPHVAPRRYGRSGAARRGRRSQVTPSSHGAGDRWRSRWCGRALLASPMIEPGRSG